MAEPCHELDSPLFCSPSHSLGHSIMSMCCHPTEKQLQEHSFGHISAARPALCNQALSSRILQIPFGGKQTIEKQKQLETMHLSVYLPIYLNIKHTHTYIKYIHTLQLTLRQHWLELCGSPPKHEFFNKYSRAQ